VLLAIDGNSLLHRAHHAWDGSGEIDRDGRPTWGSRGLLGFIAAAAARVRPEALVVGFDCLEHSVRKAEFPGYKAQRPDKSADLEAQATGAPVLLRDAGMQVVTARGYEADDVLASAAALARDGGWRAVLVTSDRDSFALIDATTSVLRVMNGGIEDSPLVTPETVSEIFQVTPGQYRDFAALRGDPSDNLPGAPGVGEKTAARLLSVFSGLDAVYDAIDGGRIAEVAAVVGPLVTARLATDDVRAELERNRRLMTMRSDLDLPDLAALRLPLDADRLAAVLSARDIRLGYSPWALVGDDPPPWTPNGFDRPPKPLPRVESGAWLTDWLNTVQPLPAIRSSRPVRRRTGGRPRPVSPGQLQLF